MHWATYHSNELALSFLLARNPDLNLQDSNGTTALHIAVERSPEIRTTAIIRSIIMRKGDPWLKNNNGSMPLDMARDKIKDEEWRRTVVSLLEDVMDINKTCG